MVIEMDKNKNNLRQPQNKFLGIVSDVKSLTSNIDQLQQKVTYTVFVKT